MGAARELRRPKVHPEGVSGNSLLRS
jgi:hypothetical protein